MIDWSKCPDVESVPGRCGGAWVVKDSRVIVESCILDNADEGATPEEIADWFEVPVDVVRRILRFVVLEGMRKKRDYTAPPGHIWVCRYCGKRARNRLRDDNPLWDESCAANAVLCREDDLPS